MSACCKHSANLHGDTVHPPRHGDPCQAVNGFRTNGDNAPPSAHCPCPGWVPPQPKGTR